MDSICELASYGGRTGTAQYVDSNKLGCSSILSSNAVALGAAVLLWVGAQRASEGQGQQLVQGCAPVVGVSVDARDSGTQVLWQVSEVAECVTHTKLLKGCNLGVLQAWLLQQSTQHLQRRPRWSHTQSRGAACRTEWCHSAGTKSSWLGVCKCMQVLVARSVLPLSSWPVALTFWALLLVKKQASCRAKDRILCGWLPVLAKAPCGMLPV